MRLWLRMLIDKTFTNISAVSIILMAGALCVILGPMIYKGTGAVFFKSTVEFRRQQFEMHGRGDKAAIEKELAQAAQYRDKVYAIIDSFRNGIDTAHLETQVRDAYREYGEQLRYNNTESLEYTNLRRNAKAIRDELLAALETADNNEALVHLDAVMVNKDKQKFTATPIERYFEIAEDYRKIVKVVDLKRRDQYAKALDDVQEQIRLLLGPRPGQHIPALSMDRYGSTRWDRAMIEMDKLMWTTQWVEAEKGKPLKKIRFAAVNTFAGTELQQLFEYVEENIDKMLLPRPTVYWQYFIDDSTPGHFFGGIGPEILGTFILTVLAMLFALPPGIISAAYLVECAGDSLAVRVIRVCINTLAGVPSVVFGLFGIAFFVLYVFPKLGMQSKPCVLAASLTLSLLILPIIIRASEEAIRAVPQTYKEASLSLGASNFKTFISVTLPSALPGILTGVILSLGRAAGETAPILFTGAVALGPIPRSVMEPTRALSYGSYDLAVGDRLATLVPHQQYGMVTVLILLVLSLNICAIVLRWKIAKRFRGV